MASYFRWRVSPTTLFVLVLALGFTSVDCGHPVEVDAGTSKPASAKDAGPDAETDPPDPPPNDAGPGPDSGAGGGPPAPGCAPGTTKLPPSPQSPGPACKCESSPGFVLNGGCGPLVLSAPYINQNDALFCDPSLAYADGVECSPDFDKITLGACVDEDTAPCIRLRRREVGEEGMEGVVTIDGHLIDGAGVVWTLSDIMLEGNLPWPAPSVTGTFKAVGARKDGEVIQVEGSFDLCVAEVTSCFKAPSKP